MIKCINCGKELEQQEGQDYVFCPKCGTKNSVVTTGIDNNTDTVKKTDKGTERDEYKNALKVGLLAFVLKYLRFIIAGVILIITIPIILVYANTGKGSLNRGDVKIDFDNSVLIGINYEDVKIKLSSAGFKNIELVSAGYDENSKIDDGSVKSVSINGETVYKSGSIFNENDVVRVVFYSKKYQEGYIITSIEKKLNSSTTELTVKNFVFDLPDYWNEEGSKTDYLRYYAEKGEQVVMLSISYPVDDDLSYDVSFDGLMADNDNMIKAIEGFFTDCDVLNYEIYESKFGVKGILYRFTFTYEKSDTDKIEGGGYYFCFPSEKDRRWFSVSMIYTSNAQYNDYKNDYLQMLSTIRAKLND